jgi:hypothetical protein
LPAFAKDLGSIHNFRRSNGIKQGVERKVPENLIINGRTHENRKLFEKNERLDQLHEIYVIRKASLRSRKN